MAAYAASVSLKVRGPKEIAPGLSILPCRVNITNYNQTLAEITGVTGRFKTVLHVVAGATDTGYLLEWIHASKSFKAWTFEDTGNVPVQVASDVDVGEADVLVYGIP